MFVKPIRETKVRALRFGHVPASRAALAACLIALVFASCSKKPEDFSLEAKVTMRDGTTVEITDFALIGSRLAEPDGWYSYQQQNVTLDIGLPVHIYGYLWREIPIAEVESAVLEPIPVRKDTSSWSLFRASIRTRAGEELTGQIPVRPVLAWHRARHYLLRGRTAAPGSKAAFEILFREVRKIEAKGESTWIVSDEKGDAFEVQELRFSFYWSAPLRREECFWKPTTAGNHHLTVKTGESETQVPLYKTKRLKITSYGDPVSVHIAARDGSEVSGALKMEDYAYFFGRTKDKRTWFGPFLGVREIEFAAPRRKTWVD